MAIELVDDVVVQEAVSRSLAPRRDGEHEDAHGVAATDQGKFARTQVLDGCATPGGRRRAVTGPGVRTDRLVADIPEGRGGRLSTQPGHGHTVLFSCRSRQAHDAECGGRGARSERKVAVGRVDEVGIARGGVGVRMIGVLGGRELRGALKEVVVDLLAVGVGAVRGDAPEDIVDEDVAAALGPDVHAQAAGHRVGRGVRRARCRVLLHEHVVFAVAVVALRAT